MMPRVLLALLLLPACLKPSPIDSVAADDTGVTGDDSQPPGDDSAPVDADGDGHTADVDCDDTDEQVYPGAEELCNGVDDDCDGQVDNGASDAGEWYSDADGDGYGDEGSTVSACEQPDDTVTRAGDCDDTNEDVYPGAEEVFDGADNDCDGVTDRMSVADASGWTILGERQDDAIGEVLEVFGDVDNDGAIDLVLGAPMADFGTRADAGVVAFHDADDQGMDRGLSEGWLNLVDALNDAHLGSSVAFLGNLDGDPADELAFGASWRNVGKTDNGAVDVLHVQGYSGNATLDSGHAEVEFYGRNHYAYAGSALAAGDLNGDGEPDLAMGCEGDDDGRVYVAFGDGALEGSGGKVDQGEFHVHAEAEDDLVGSALLAGDINSDGYDDLWICAAGSDSGGEDAGTCYLIEGNDELHTIGGHPNVQDIAAARVQGSGADDGLGLRSRQLLMAQLDGSGDPELAVGVPGRDRLAPNGGAVWVFTGPFSGTLTHSDATVIFNGDGGLGAALSEGGDLDEDGAADILVGAPEWEGAGAVFLLNLDGRVGELTAADVASAAWFGEEEGDRFGAGVSDAADLDGDGRADFAAGAPGFDTSDDDAGKVYVLPGLR
ncbi:MAG: FG-GAP repeat protein [Alphaproteobacteria bacterium]|nr:FG-GAP repeat protein [Alphaproteobacteria bacterium]MCB9796831.1 FG-GAP repeat protein [Alphaproteobacteria bacterium]